MKLKLKVGIVGCGAIGSSLAGIIKRDFRHQARLSGLFDLDKAKSLKLAKELGKLSLNANSLISLIKNSGLIIEATQAKFSFSIASQALEHGCDVMIMSVGGVIDKYSRLASLAQRKQASVYIPSGAIAGLDGLKALALAKIRKVTLTTSKPPAGLGLKELNKDKVLFDGKAGIAVKKFPQNVNVAAVLSLAGIGAQKTRVRIVASARLKRNTHEIEIISDAGRITARSENVAHPQNPKTSYLAVLSAAAVLKQILAPVKIGT